MQLSCLLPHPETCPDLAAKLAATRTVHGVFGWCEEVQCGASGPKAERGWGMLHWQDESSNWNKAQRSHLELRFKGALTS